MTQDNCNTGDPRCFPTNSPPAKAVEPIKIPQKGDLNIHEKMLLGYAQQFYPEIELAELDREATYVDDLYHDSTVKKFKTPVTILSFVEHNPSKKLLTRYGMDEQRDVVFNIPVSFLVQAGIVLQSDTYLIGSLIKWGGDNYEIRDQNYPVDSYWMNTNIPFYVSLAADYYRQEV
jgi:hypothetical protein